MKQKNFKEIYDNIYSSVGPEIEFQRKKALKNNIMAFLIILLIWGGVLYFALNISQVFMFVFIFVFIISIIVMAFVTSKINKNYKKEFKEKVINEIVKRSNPKLEYSYDNGLTPETYRNSHFESYWDRFHSEDMISGELENGTYVRMSQVHTEDRETTTDSDGHTTTTYVTKFYGLFGVIELKTQTRADFMIMNNSKLSKFNKNRIEMESSEFEKYYDVFSSSKESSIRQNAMEILTPETIEKFVAIRNVFKKSINVRVHNNIIYFRIDVGDIFEPPTFKSSLNFEMLNKYFLIIDVPRMIYEALIDNILVMYGNSSDREKRNLSNNSESDNNF